MAVIFIREKITEILSQNKVFLKATNIIINHKKSVKAAALTVCGAAAVFISLSASGVTFAYNVQYSGSNIATVKSSSVFYEAKHLAVKSTAGKKAESAIKSPRFSLTLAVSGRLDNALYLADAIIKNTSELTAASVLTVNGEKIACADADDIETVLENRRTAYYVDGAENSAEFTDKIEIINGYCLKSELCDSEQLASIAESFNVKTEIKTSADIEVPFDKKSVKTDSQPVGYSVVTTSGQNGINRKTETAVKLNGDTITSSEPEITVIKEPVTQITTIGTAVIKSTPSASVKTLGAKGFIVPISAHYTVSCHYGEGGHKGIDMATKNGTPIMASAAGTVVESGFRNDYGYNVVIDHGNGIKTRYAHASVLKVSKGQTVNAGDIIALVGSTGYSTGNHLHFEVIAGGSRVNPTPYIGVK